MRHLVPVTASFLVLAGVPLAAQAPAPSALDALAFMSGCWSGPTLTRAGAGTVEERWAPPTSNVMLGMSRTVVGGRTAEFEFLLVTADSAGVTLVPFPNGVRSSDVFRLTKAAGDSAVFEAPEHDYPKRILYARTVQGLTARIDGGADDLRPRSWPMGPAACVTGPNAGAMATVQGPAPRPAGPDRGGRVLLYFTQTLNGLYLGLAVPAMMSSGDATAYGLGLLLGAPAGIFFAKAVNDARPVSLGQATAISWGGWWGWWNGLGIWAIGGSDDGSQFFAHTAVGMVAGTTAGMIMARRPIAAGDASLVAHASAWGTWYGTVLSVVSDADADTGWLMVLGAGNAFLVGAAVATRSTDISAGRVWVTTAAGIAGLVAGFGIDLLVQADNARTVILIPGITSAIGLAAGYTMSRSLDDREARGAAAPEPVLLGVRDGRLRLGVPAPTPALLPRDDGRRRSWVPGMRVTVFEWRH